MVGGVGSCRLLVVVCSVGPRALFALAVALKLRRRSQNGKQNLYARGRDLVGHLQNPGCEKV